MMSMTIARAARAASVGVETVRFYERRGLIKQPRKPRSGFREYDAETVSRICFIRQAQELGFSLREIKELLSLRADPGADCADVRIRAIKKRDEVERKVAELGRIRAALDTLIASCPGGGALRACTILDAIEHVPVAKTRARPARVTGAQEKPRNKQRGVSSAMKTAIFTIEGMHCDGCADTIKALLSLEPGVQAATVLFKDGNAKVLYDPAATREDRLIAAIERGGYKAVRQPA
ncbi:MAG: MerR family DNA-binding protein [Rhizobiales bacterium]|nr:MerR family DNA-binding protein [Hyphomicrobiales bacterium]